MRMRRTTWWCATAVSLSLLIARRDAYAGGGAATDAYEDIRPGTALDVHAMLDIYAQHDFNRPSNDLPGLHAFELRDDEIALGFARVTLAHRPGPSVIGFRIDAGVGDTPNAYMRSDPAMARHPDVARAFSFAEQAFVTALLPIGSGVSLDVGKFGTPVGLEENEAHLNWNYTRSLLFTLAEPTYHTGARATYSLSKTFAVSAAWLNGWNANVVDGNGMRSFAGAFTWVATKRLELTLTYAAGLERAPLRLADSALLFRHELAATATLTLTDRVTFAAAADYGTDEASGGGAWWGVAAYARVRALPWLFTTLRGETFGDPAGYITGGKRRIVEGTATVEARHTVRDVTIIGRVEYRRDQSDTPAFQASALPLLARQETLTLGCMLVY